MKDISFYIDDVLLGESKKLVELKKNDAEVALIEAGFKKNKDFFEDSNNIYVRSEKIAQDIADELADSDYEVTYDDSNSKKIIVTILK